MHPLVKRLNPALAIALLAALAGCGGDKGPKILNFTADPTSLPAGGGNVTLTGTRIIGTNESPDGCVWRTDHLIQGNVSSGTLSYSYSENFVQGTNCWFPCTETGTIEVQWVQ